MKKKISLLITALLLCLALLPATAAAADLDYIRQYDVTVRPNVEDGSLHILLEFQWEVLDDLPYGLELQIGVPNGSIREVHALTDNIESLDFDNSLMYVYFTQGYDKGEIINFSYSWVQEYMYSLPTEGGVTYSYTPGWFDGAKIGSMTLKWLSPEEAPLGLNYSADWTGGTWVDSSDGAAWHQLTGTDLGHGDRIEFIAYYPAWPTALSWDNSSANLPTDDWGWEDDYYGDYESDPAERIIAMFGVVIMVVIIITIIVAISSATSYRGGFGTTRYVCAHGLWYPAGRDGRPRPGSVGVKNKPAPPKPPKRRSGGFGGGSRGGGFGGGGFSGGSRCACASSCACACACACAGGGRAGCSAKNLYGSVRLDKRLTQQLNK